VRFLFSLYPQKKVLITLGANNGNNWGELHIDKQETNAENMGG
jgi:hypothetical protein